MVILVIFVEVTVLLLLQPFNLQDEGTKQCVQRYI